jgi:hypothetical protein
VREVAREQHVARLGAETIAHPLRRIVGLKIFRRGEFRKRIARAPEFLRGFLRAELSAVPHDGRPSAAARRLRRNPHDVRPSGLRQRTTSVDVGADRFTVMDQENVHGASADFLVSYW